MSRAELIEVIYRLQQNEQELRRENDELKAQLADRRTHLSEAGSIAQAALALNDVFARAQAAADDYLAEIAELRDKLAARAQAGAASMPEISAAVTLDVPVVPTSEQAASTAATPAADPVETDDSAAPAPAHFAKPTAF